LSTIKYSKTNITKSLLRAKVEHGSLVSPSDNDNEQCLELTSIGPQSRIFFNDKQQSSIRHIELSAAFHLKLQLRL